MLYLERMGSNSVLNDIMDVFTHNSYDRENWSNLMVKFTIGKVDSGYSGKEPWIQLCYSLVYRYKYVS